MDNKFEIGAKLIPKDEVVRMAWNQALPTPLKLGESVEVVEDINEDFVKVEHKENKFKAVFNKLHFYSEEEYKKFLEQKEAKKKEKEEKKEKDE
jgi:hypothetical protein